jgi:hypothetical protein
MATRQRRKKTGNRRNLTKDWTFPSSLPCLENRAVQAVPYARSFPMPVPYAPRNTPNGDREAARLEGKVRRRARAEDAANAGTARGWMATEEPRGRRDQRPTNRAILCTWAGKWKHVACHGFFGFWFLIESNSASVLRISSISAFRSWGILSVGGNADSTSWLASSSSRRSFWGIKMSWRCIEINGIFPPWRRCLNG